MAYLREYSIYIKTKNKDKVDVEMTRTLLKEITGYYFKSAYDPLPLRLYGFVWYNHEEDMKELSKKLGENYIFEVDVFGEEPEDFYMKCFVDGEMAVYR